MIDKLRNFVRQQMTLLARLLNKLTGGRLRPNHVSIISLVGHVWVLWLLARGDLRLAVPVLILFGLMDALDGALARLQGSQSAAGMLLDATSDRVKEALIYLGLTEYFIQQNNSNGVRLSIVILAGSMLVSYVKAKGETALTDATANEKNQALKDGFARYEVRMTILLVGLLWQRYLLVDLSILAGLVWLTALSRFIRIYRRLS